MSEPSGKHLRAIIQTQTEIAASDLDLDVVMELIASRGQELTRGSAGVIELADGDEMVYWTTTGEATPFLGVRLGRETSLSGLCVAEGRVLRSDDTDTDPRVEGQVRELVDARSMLCAPLTHQDETVGVLKVYATDPHHFSDSDIETVELLSGLVAAHMSRASLFAAEAHLGRHDALTGLLNRRAYEERLPVEISRAGRFGRPLSLCLLDLDGFKKINDSHGHAAGDAALREVARRLRRCVRERDLVARLGGDEFVVVLNDVGGSPGAAQEACERVDAALAEPIALEQEEMTLRAAIGVATFPGDGADAPSLLAFADRAMYAAKHRRRVDSAA
jgi:diguanylate cyclase (GGDEF)-like protein